jgi:hypothetical protein
MTEGFGIVVVMFDDPWAVMAAAEVGAGRLEAIQGSEP